MAADRNHGTTKSEQELNEFGILPNCCFADLPQTCLLLMPSHNATSLDFEAIFSATTSAYLMLDTKLMIVGVNDAYLRATERTRESVMGKHVFDAFPTNPSEPGASGIPSLQRSLERVIETGLVDHVELLRFDIPMGPGENAPFVTRYWSPINSPVFSRDGELTHIIHHAVDITKQVESEKSRRESEGRYKALVDASGVAIYRVTPDWSHLYPFEGRGFLKGTSHLDEYQLEDYVPVEDQAMVSNAIDEAIRTKGIFELEHRVLRVDGSVGWTFSRAVPILDGDGEIVEWIGSAGDITANKITEEQLRNTDRRKDEFLAMLSHELRNPLAPISAAAELLHLGRLNQTRVVQISDIIARQVKHMTSLVDDLLDVSRVTRGLVVLKRETVDINGVVADAIEQVQPLIASRSQHLAVHLPPNAALVSGDMKRLVQVVTNLLNNASKYTPGSGVIDLEVQTDKENITIVVKDSGIGMANEFLDHVFDLFSQAQRTSDRSQGGLGIGLALSKSLVALHNGSIVAKSAGLGLGSEFTVQLPRHTMQTLERPMLSGEATNIRPCGLKVMIVDDNLDAANMLAMWLEASGHEVIVEHVSQTALKRAPDENPDVFLLDIGMPDMDGNELARQLRLLPELASSCLIAVTGYGQEQDIKSTNAAGFDYHFVKPVDMTQLTSLFAALSAPKEM